LVNEAKAREIERIARDAEKRVRHAKEQVDGVTSIAARPGCGEGRYWNRVAQACVEKR
jgi:hypothetical protein